jgi:hypothetical protein
MNNKGREVLDVRAGDDIDASMVNREATAGAVHRPVRFDPEG